LIGDGSALTDSSIPSKDFRLTDDERAQLKTHLGAKAVTTFPGQTVDPRPHIFFNSTAARTAWGGYGDRDSLRENFAHELMHAGGIPGQKLSYFGSFFQHDLSHLNGYFDRPFSRLLSNCRRK
jgi:hypothetical protein